MKIQSLLHVCSEFYDVEKKKEEEEEGRKEKEGKPEEGGKDTPMDDSGGAGMLTVHQVLTSPSC